MKTTMEMECEVWNLFDSGPVSWVLYRHPVYCVLNELKGQRGNCSYNQQWELNFKYKGWLTAFKADRKKALCKCCDWMIDISNMGESALKLHNYEKCERHKNNSRTGGEQAVTLSSSGFVTCGSFVLWKSCLWKGTPWILYKVLEKSW